MLDKNAGANAQIHWRHQRIRKSKSKISIWHGMRDHSPMWLLQVFPEMPETTEPVSHVPRMHEMVVSAFFSVQAGTFRWAGKWLVTRNSPARTSLDQKRIKASACAQRRSFLRQLMQGTRSICTAQAASWLVCMLTASVTAEEQRQSERIEGVSGHPNRSKSTLRRSFAGSADKYLASLLKTARCGLRTEAGR